ncbi:MAG: hypothetical protein AB4038_16065 [Prochloraceae cyanobacterium]
MKEKPAQRLALTIIGVSLILNYLATKVEAFPRLTTTRENRQFSPVLLTQAQQSWRMMTDTEKNAQIESLINSRMGIAALNQLALEGFIGFGCARSFYINQKYGGFQTLMRVKCNEPKGASTAIGYDEIRVIFNRFEDNIENFEIERVSKETGSPKIRLPQ